MIMSKNLQQSGLQPPQEMTPFENALSEKSAKGLLAKDGGSPLVTTQSVLLSGSEGLVQGGKSAVNIDKGLSEGRKSGDKRKKERGKIRMKGIQKNKKRPPLSVRDLLKKKVAKRRALEKKRKKLKKRKHFRTFKEALQNFQDHSRKMKAKALQNFQGESTSEETFIRGEGGLIKSRGGELKDK